LETRTPNAAQLHQETEHFCALKRICLFGLIRLCGKRGLEARKADIWVWTTRGDDFAIGRGEMVEPCKKASQVQRYNRKTIQKTSQVQRHNRKSMKKTSFCAPWVYLNSTNIINPWLGNQPLPYPASDETCKQIIQGVSFLPLLLRPFRG
jgi:hypothetical protein